MSWLVTASVVVGIILLSSLKVVYQYQRGVKFTLGKYVGIMEPGLRVVVPVIQSWQRVDNRTRVVDVPEQDAMTKDNVSVLINAVIYFKVMKSDKAILQVEQYFYALTQLAQTTMRDAVGEVSLDELLSSREEISARIQSIVDKATDPWGIKVQMVELKDIKLPDQMIRTMAKEAEAEREKRAVIIKAEGEVIASENMSKAATTLASATGGLHLRTLQSLNYISSDQTNTTVFAVPLEIANAMEGISTGKGWKK